MPSLSGVFNLQSFTDLGALAAGYRLYTYAPGTTTHKSAYTDQAGTIPHTYTSDGSGGQYIALDARGELPAPLWLAAGGYDVSLKTSTGASVWTRRAYGADEGIAELSDSTDVAHGDAMVAVKRTDSGAIATTVHQWIEGAWLDAGRDFGVSGSGNQTTKLQAAITAAQSSGKPLVIPPGTWDVATTGLTTSPVGDALTITGPIKLILCGTLKATNNCNVLRINAGATDRVEIVTIGGALEGHGTYYWLTNNNGSCLKISAGDVRIHSLRVVNPPQYGVIIYACSNGQLNDCEVVGGPTSYSGVAQNNHYGVCLVDASTGWRINNLLVRPSSSNGRVSQGIASLTFSSGTADRLQVNDYKCLGAWEKGCYIYGDDVQMDSPQVYDTPNGEGLRLIGKRCVISNPSIRSTIGGGITLYNAEGSKIIGGIISNFEQSGIQIAYGNDSVGNGAAAGKSLDDIIVDGVSIHGATVGTNLGRAIDVRGHSSTNTVIERIKLRNLDIKNGDMGTADNAAVDIFPQGAGGTTFRDLEIDNVNVFRAGGYGVRFRAGTYAYCKLLNCTVSDPAMNVVDRAGFRWDNSVSWVGQEISNCEARADLSAEMLYGFDSTALGNVQSTMISNNHVRGYKTGGGGYNNMHHATNSRRGNRVGDSPLHGIVNLSAASSTVVSNTNSSATMRVRMIPANAAAGTLMQGAKSLYFDSTVVAGTSFTVKTADGTAAAGTEQFFYEVDL